MPCPICIRSLNLSRWMLQRNLCWPSAVSASKTTVFSLILTSLVTISPTCCLSSGHSTLSICRCLLPNVIPSKSVPRNIPAVFSRRLRPTIQVAMTTITSATNGMDQSFIHWLVVIPTIIHTANGSSGAWIFICVLSIPSAKIRINEDNTKIFLYQKFGSVRFIVYICRQKQNNYQKRIWKQLHWTKHSWAFWDC